jgi:cell division protein FtsB
MAATVTLIAKLATAGVLTATLLGVQPEPRPTSEGRGGRKVEQPVDRATLRARLERKLAETKESATALESGIRQLDEGADPGEISRTLDRRGGRNDWGRPDGGRGPGRGDGMGGGGGGDNSPITEEEKKTLLALLKEAMPTMADRYEKMRNSDPEGADRMVGRILPRLREVASLRAKDPGLFELKIGEMRATSDVFAAVQALRDHKGGEDGKAALRATLREAVSRQFDSRQAAQRREITDLEKRIADLKAETARKESERDQAIEEFTKKLEEMPEPGSRRQGKRPE